MSRPQNHARNEPVGIMNKKRRKRGWKKSE
jgi:hypothetical protein